jgi:predicted nucleic acid-binding protein
MIVVDASVIIKWIKSDERDSDAAKSLYLKHVHTTEKIIVPKLLYFEVANYLATKTQFSRDDIRDGMNLIYKAKLEIHEMEMKELILSSIAAKDYKTSVYDMSYAVIAQKYKTVLITADEKFVKATKFPFVKLLSEFDAS